MRGAIRDIDELRESDCAHNMPEGIRSRLGLFSLNMNKLENRMQLRRKDFIDVDVDQKSMEKYIEYIRKIMDWLDDECHTMCKLYHIAWEKED